MGICHDFFLENRMVQGLEAPTISDFHVWRIQGDLNLSMLGWLRSKGYYQKGVLHHVWMILLHSATPLRTHARWGVNQHNWYLVTVGIGDPSSVAAQWYFGTQPSGNHSWKPNHTLIIGIFPCQIINYPGLQLSQWCFFWIAKLVGKKNIISQLLPGSFPRYESKCLLNWLDT